MSFLQQKISFSTCLLADLTTLLLVCIFLENLYIFYLLESTSSVWLGNSVHMLFMLIIGLLPEYLLFSPFCLCQFLGPGPFYSFYDFVFVRGLDTFPAVILLKNTTFFELKQKYYFLDNLHPSINKSALFFLSRAKKVWQLKYRCQQALI